MAKPKIISKAWRVSHPKLDYQPFYEILYGETANVARAGLEKIDSDFRYIENRSHRRPADDIIEIDSIRGTLHMVLHKIKQANRVQRIKDLPDDDTLYVIANGYVGNALLCWGHNGNGYTCIWENIGQYSNQIIQQKQLKD